MYYGLDVGRHCAGYPSCKQPAVCDSLPTHIEVAAKRSAHLMLLRRAVELVRGPLNMQEG